MGTYDWLFDNPELADLIVVLTTESEEACIARLEDSSGIANVSTSLQPSGAAERARSASTDEEAPIEQVTGAEVYEELPAHKFALFSHSKFFKAAVGWPSRPTKKRKLLEDGQAHVEVRPEHEEGCDISSRERVVISLKDEGPEWLPAARRMIQFTYTNQLPDGVTLTEVMSLYTLGNRFEMNELREACLVHFSEVPFGNYTPEEQRLLLSLHDRLHADQLSSGTVGAAAAATVHSVQETLQELEDYWQEEQNRLTFMSAPFEIVLPVLQCADLAVRSEDTVLVAALSWLRGEVGRSASLDERRQVLAAVRLLQLTPWFSTWLLCSVDEVKELLELDDRMHLELYPRVKLASSAQANELLEVSPQLKQWSMARLGRKPAAAQLTCAWTKSDAVAAVTAARTANTSELRHAGDQAFSAGFDYRLSFSVEGGRGEGGDCVVFWSGLHTDVWVARAKVQAGPGVPLWPVSVVWRQGPSPTETESSVGKTPLGIGYGYSTNIKEGADIEEELQDWLVGDAYVLNVKLGA